MWFGEFRALAIMPNDLSSSHDGMQALYQPIAIAVDLYKILYEIIHGRDNVINASLLGSYDTEAISQGYRIILYMCVHPKSLEVVCSERATRPS